MKPEIRILGIDDASFSKDHIEDVNLDSDGIVDAVEVKE
jgi:endonuclease V-like protein UPF0215 family